jgi:acyl-coenzyme A thioesterase PaaI-like protein
METKYKLPVPTDKGKLYLRAKVLKTERSLVSVQVKLYGPDDKVLTEGLVKYFTFPENVARERMYYPEYDEFFEKE